MEGADVVAIETEQPRPSGSPVPEEYGAGKPVEAGTVTQLPVADGRESSVDGDAAPRVDLKDSAESGQEANTPVMDKTKDTGVAVEEKQEAAVAAPLNESVQPQVKDEVKAEDMKTESVSENATKAPVQKLEEEAKEAETTTEESAENDAKPKAEKGLCKLAQQIDDFTSLLGTSPSASLTEKSAVDNDNVIDDLIKEMSDDTDVNVKSGDVVAEGKVENNEGKVTPEMSNGSNGNAVKDGDAVDLSNAESNGVHDKASPNGSMSASTESEGFQDDKGEVEPAVEETEEILQESKQSDKKDVTDKLESPTKSSKSKKKEDKSIEHILKALSSLQSTEEKLAALCKKYADLHEEHRILQASFKQSQRKLTVVTREKDQLQTEHTKAMMAKSKLESLCRELQKHNQTIRQESLQRAKEEDDKRKEISQKFQTTIGEIQTQMQENHERNKQLREENFELANKLKKFIEQYELREKQVEKVIQHRELEQKLADAKLEQASAILMEEKGRNQKEKELLVIQATEYMKKMQLKDAELSMYKERYEEFQTTIKRSEEMFSKFKTEMDKMSKRCRKVEKEGASWKSKWDNANRALLAMAEEKTKYDKERPLLVAKIQKLESLCRAMQAERQARNILETEGVDLSKLSLAPETSTSPSPKPTDTSPVPTATPSSLGATGTTEGAESGAAADSGAGVEGEEDSGSTGEDGEENVEEGSDHSSASGETGVTVIKQDPEESSQSEAPAQSDLNQSEESTQNATTSEPAS